MSNNWAGYLLKATKTNTIFPLEYITFNTWKSTPKQREELKAYRDDNTRSLTRVTAQGKKSIFSFTVRPGLNLDQKIELLNFFYNNESNQVERKINLQYWNDDASDYDTGDFYRPNLEFPIIRVDANTIIYGELKLEFIEY